MRRSFFATIGFLSVLMLALPVLAQGSPARSPAKKKIEMRLFSASDFNRMSDVEKEQYLEALREFHEARQERAQASSLFFLDEILQSFQASAQTTDCRKAMLEPNRSVFPASCTDDLERAARSGALGLCITSPVGATTTAGQAAMTMDCSRTLNGTTYRRQYTVQGETAKIRDMKTKIEERQQPIAQRQEQITTDAGPGAAPRPAAAPQAAPGAPTAPTTTQPPAAGPGARPQARPSNDDSARCFFGGFALNKPAEGSKCLPVTDLCKQTHLRAPRSESLTKAIGCGPNNVEIGKCGGRKGVSETAAAPAAAPAGGTNPIRAADKQVVCNPILYGTQADETMICVPRNSRASANCGSKKNDETLKNLLKKPDGIKAFDEMIKSLEKECLPYWKIEGTNVTEKSEGVPERQGDDFKTDFKDTCGVLLRRALEIGAASEDPQIKGKVEALKRSPQAPTAPATAPTAAPTSPAGTRR